MLVIVMEMRSTVPKIEVGMIVTVVVGVSLTTVDVENSMP